MFLLKVIVSSINNYLFAQVLQAKGLWRSEAQVAKWGSRIILDHNIGSRQSFTLQKQTLDYATEIFTRIHPLFLTKFGTAFCSQSLEKTTQSLSESSPFWLLWNNFTKESLQDPNFLFICSPGRVELFMCCPLLLANILSSGLNVPFWLWHLSLTPRITNRCWAVAAFSFRQAASRLFCLFFLLLRTSRLALFASAWPPAGVSSLKVMWWEAAVLCEHQSRVWMEKRMRREG